jgi:hypothetical protein
LSAKRATRALTERWRAPVPGIVAITVLSDTASGSVFASDGWGVSYAALRLHRFDLETGAHLAELRTRHQAVSAMLVDRNVLYAATDSRLFELSPTDLSVSRQWDRGLVRYTQQLVPAGSKLVTANWLKPTIGLFDPETGLTRGLRAGLQPLLVRQGEAVKVIAGFDGRMWTLDTTEQRLVDVQTIPPVARAAAGREIWGVLAGSPEGGQGNPPVWTKPPGNRLLRLPAGAPRRRQTRRGCRRNGRARC